MNIGRICSVLSSLIFALPLLAMENLPDVSKLDQAWGKDSVHIAGWGWNSCKKDTDLTDIPFTLLKPGPSLAIPYNNRYMDFMLKNPELLSRIVLDCEQLNAYKVKGDEIREAFVYVSMDGKKYKLVKTGIEQLFYTKTDYRKKVTLCNRITLKGDFYGRYFRIYIPWAQDSYIYRVLYDHKHVKVFAKINFAGLNVPMSTDGKFNCTFQLAGHNGENGKVAVRLKNGNILAEKDVSGLKNSSVCTIPLQIKDVPYGVHTLEVSAIGSDGIIWATREIKIFYLPEKKILKTEKHTNWSIKNILIGNTTVPFYSADKANAKIEFNIPVSGSYAVYAVIRGKSAFTFNAPGVKKNNVVLDLWAPKHDSNQWITGENFLGIYEFKTGDNISFTAKNAGAQLGEVFIVKADDEQKKIFAEKSLPGRRSIISHGDGFSDFFRREITEKILHDRIKNTASGNVIAYDWCVGTCATNYPSKVSTMFGKQRNVRFARKGDRLAAERVEKLIRTTGKDSVQILREATRKYNVRYTVTLRANAFYSAKNCDKNAQYLIDHPEFGIVQRWGKTPKPSYAYKEVRDFYLAMAKEIAAYKPDALVIDFLRHPAFFGYDKPLIDEYTRLYGFCNWNDVGNERWQKMIGEIMTGWLREVRSEIKKIHPAIELEVHIDCENYKKYGTPVDRFLEEGLVDAISPGFYGNGPEKLFSLTPFREMIKKSPIPVKLYPRVESTIDGHDPTPEEEAGLVKRPVQIYCSNNQWKSIYYRFMMDGADGIRPFNTGGPGMARMLNDWAEVRRFVIFTEPLLDIRRLGFEK